MYFIIKDFGFSTAPYSVTVCSVCFVLRVLLIDRHSIYIYIYIYIYRQVLSLESYMSRVLNTVVELIRLEDKLELLHMNFISQSSLYFIKFV